MWRRMRRQKGRPADMTQRARQVGFGLVLVALVTGLSLYVARDHLRPVAPIFACEIWPPSESATVVIFSLVFVRAMSTAMFETFPEVDLTSANRHPKTSFARSSQMDAILSTKMFPW